MQLYVGMKVKNNYPTSSARHRFQTGVITRVGQAVAWARYSDGDETSMRLEYYIPVFNCPMEDRHEMD